jgi:hypothetical protein
MTNLNNHELSIDELDCVAGGIEINAGIIAIKIEKDGISIATPFGGIAASGGTVVVWGPGGSPK